MACSCKGNTNIKTSEINDGKVSQSVLMYALKLLGFLLVVILFPIISLVILWFIFKTLVLSKEIDIKPLLLAIGKSFKEKDEDEDDDIENLTEEDVIMLDVDEIKK